MELLFAIAIIILVAAGWFIYRNKGLDANKDGVVNANDIKPAVEQAAEDLKVAAVNAVDINKDGIVNKEDAKEVVKKIKTTAKKVATKKPATKAPASKEPAKPATKARKPRMTVAK